MNSVIIHFPKHIAWLLIAGLCMGCSAHTQNQGASAIQKIEGSVWYRERMLLPPNAEVYVALEDVSRMDVAADIIASTRFTPKGGPPYGFSLAYDPARIHAKGRYGLRVRIEVEGKLMFINTTHVPAFDRAPGDQPVKIMVSRVGKSRPATKPNAGLVDTYWKLTELNGKPATLGTGQKELNMVLTSEGNRVHGFSGCNQFSGSYEKNEGQLGFGPMAATMMACMESMQLEQAFLQALGKTTRYTLHGGDLKLFNAEEKLILRFRAVYQE